MVAGLLLPAPSADLVHATNSLVAGQTSPSSDSRSLDRGYDDTCTPVAAGVVERPRVVCRVGDDGCDAAVDLSDEIDAGRCVIQVRIGQQLSADDSSVVDAEMELPPALDAPAAVFDGGRLDSNPWGVPGFSALFFMMTGFHGTHVLIGVVILVVTMLRAKAGKATAEGVELAGLYWHFVDLVWVFIFGCFYLI